MSAHIHVHCTHRTRARPVGPLNELLRVRDYRALAYHSQTIVVSLSDPAATSARLLFLAVVVHTTSPRGRRTPIVAVALPLLHSVAERSRTTCSTLRTSHGSHTSAVAGSASVT